MERPEELPMPDCDKSVVYQFDILVRNSNYNDFSLDKLICILYLCITQLS